TRMVWLRLVPLLTESGPLGPDHPRRIIEGRFADELPPMTDPVGAVDYPSIVQAYRLAHVVGIDRLAGAFMLGRVDQMMSALTVVLLGSPVRPLTMPELELVVQHLAKQPTDALERLRVNVYMDNVTEDDLDPVLSQAGAAPVTVFSPSRT